MSIPHQGLWRLGTKWSVTPSEATLLPVMKSKVQVHQQRAIIIIHSLRPALSWQQTVTDLIGISFVYPNHMNCIGEVMEPPQPAISCLGWRCPKLCPIGGNNIQQYDVYNTIVIYNSSSSSRRLQNVISGRAEKRTLEWPPCENNLPCCRHCRHHLYGGGSHKVTQLERRGWAWIAET